jgi:Tfp pilus assembly PilM family ATPase
MVLSGNGARLLGLAARLERDTGCSVDVADHLTVSKSAYPEDTVRASAPDWALAVGLATWPVREPSAA